MRRRGTGRCAGRRRACATGEATNGHALAGADDALREHRGLGERVVVAERVDVVVLGAEDRDRLAVHQRGRAALDRELDDRGRPAATPPHAASAAGVIREPLPGPPNVGAQRQAPVSSCNSRENTPPDRSGLRRLRGVPAAVVILAAGTGSRVGAGSNKVLLPARRPAGAGLVGARRARALRRRTAGCSSWSAPASRTTSPPRSRRTSATARSAWSRAARPGTPRSGPRCARCAPRSRPARSTWSRSTTAPGRSPVRRCSRRRSRPRASTAARSRSSGCPGLLARDGRDAAARARRRADPAGVPGRRPARGLHRAPPPTASTAPTPPPAGPATPTCRSRPCPSSPANLKITFPEDLDLALRWPGSP